MSGFGLRTTIVAIGRFGAKDPERLLFEAYAARLKPAPDLVEREARRLAGSARQAHEGELLLAAVPEGAAVVALDGGGEMLSSEALAARLARLAGTGTSRLAFLIGGADGHHRAVLDRAAFCYSFGPATWPHLMVRAMLAEQLYRAATILDGHPYHRG